MKKTLFFSLLMTITSFAWGERFEDHIHDVVVGNKGEEHIVYLESGRVVFVDQNQSPYYRPSDFKTGERVELEVDKRLTLRSLTSLPPIKTPEELEPIEESVSQDATILPDHATANRIFRNMNTSWKRNTECTDRAHVWSYEEWKKSGLIQNKVFLFFTNTYIRRYRYNWWFHVSPYTLIQENGGVVEHVMDRMFTRVPYHMKNWTDVFIRSKRSCPVKTYSYYRANRNGPEHCILVKSTMYYRLPLHVRNMEDSGIIKTQFNSAEVNFTYRAFTRRGAK